jgi:AraC family transcriptional regulator of adaptative response/methylated-DNA-[protein]-cysteine methyltransferase
LKPPAEIRHTSGKCALGTLLVARGERGICMIALGDDPEILLRELRENFPRDRLIAGNRDDKQTLAQVADLIAHPARNFTLPLDMRGTEFQRRVWQALRKIPPGTTRTYAEIAAQLGNPNAARAVGNACAANILALAIPCHRALRADGTLSGYRWGVERKRILLEKEQAGC